jgi:hypothetical protein
MKDERYGIESLDDVPDEFKQKLFAEKTIWEDSPIITMDDFVAWMEDNERQIIERYLESIEGENKMEISKEDFRRLMYDAFYYSDSKSRAAGLCFDDWLEAMTKRIEQEGCDWLEDYFTKFDAERGVGVKDGTVVGESREAEAPIYSEKDDAEDFP